MFKRSNSYQIKQLIVLEKCVQNFFFFDLKKKIVKFVAEVYSHKGVREVKNPTLHFLIHNYS